PGNHVHGIVQLACSYRDYLSGVNSVMLWIYGDTDPLLLHDVPAGENGTVFNWVTTTETDGFMEVFLYAYDEIGNVNQTSLGVFVENEDFIARVYWTAGVGIGLLLVGAIWVVQKGLGLAVLRLWERVSQGIGELARSRSFEQLLRGLNKRYGGKGGGRELTGI
ncbi:MAG: hypothetical protein ACTSU5_09515, partial [Promethearchaeota archaeon]